MRVVVAVWVSTSWVANRWVMFSSRLMAVAIRKPLNCYYYTWLRRVARQFHRHSYRDAALGCCLSSATQTIFLYLNVKGPAGESEQGLYQ
jgi:hypothetical protein